MINIKTVFINLLKIFYLILILFLAYQVIKVIIGGTWETENIIIAGMGVIIAGMFVIVGFLINQGIILGMVDERTRGLNERVKNIGDSLIKLGGDFKKHLQEFHNEK
ncbi:hypothetical protein J4221_03750 [Candidatus Pacearchaeota archaeon]|nr:hypothetical protein [Candidatus Pacearchaeota archaeon]